VTKEFNSRLSWTCLFVGIAVLYAATGLLCVSLSAQVANVSWMLYIPSGLSMMAALLWGSRVWPAIFVGELAMGIASGLGFTGASIMAFGNGLDAALTGWLFRDRLCRRIELDRTREVVQLLAAQLLILQPLCTVIGIAGLVVTGHMPPHRLRSTAAAFYLANLSAQFISAPLAIGWLRWRRPAARRAEYLELAALVLVTIVVGSLGPGRYGARPFSLPITLILVFPLLAWAATRFVPSVAVTVGTALGLFAFDAAFAGVGPFQGYSTAEQMVYLNIFTSVSIGTGLFLAAASANERRFEAEQADLIRRLQDAADNMSRLKEFVTFCAWSGRVKWKDDWVTVETFLRERYGLNVTHSISDESIRKFMRDAGLVEAQETGAAGPPQAQ
jgi:integral membrane sensor domain MASE1